jgi:hypothetical protein
MLDGAGNTADDDRVFKALASSTRRRMLEQAELVVGRKVGRERHLALAPLPIKRIHDRWIGDYTRAAVELLDRLESGS